MVLCGEDPVHAAIPARRGCRPDRCRDCVHRGWPSPAGSAPARPSEVLGAALALLTVPPAYLVGDCPTCQAGIRLVAACGLDRL